ncbi:MAG: bifunctional glutamate N-acetyltransferase/amino-acid acetyltransferase ArgJ [Firmicutes bacterium]|nr:bifunctional glutamate N-acetyltransferase/amino-acid acetyltransferase ArgJ [Bacillota bacterium]
MKTISGGIAAPKGFKADAFACGIKKNNQVDLAIIASEVPAAAAGIFTTNRVQAAPVLLSRERIKKGTAQAIIANSGNANACVGPAGMKAARLMSEALAERLNIKPEAVLVASTGVIGVELPVDRIQAALSGKNLFISPNGEAQAARAIMTTDTFPKVAAVEFELDGVPVRIGGIAKGSGMIHPNMATMLGFITTDLAIQPKILQKALAHAGERSFNRITVDGDTSTNDCLLTLANGKAGNKPITKTNEAYQTFLKALTYVCLELAKLIARDGEGATKFVEIKVTGAKTEGEAVKIGKAVATSNLVKTAIFGGDANWGRILAAAGYSGVKFNPDLVNIYIGDLLVCRGGAGLVFDEAKAKEILKQKELLIRIEMGSGKEEASIWTCDLSYDYVKINGSYRS